VRRQKYAVTRALEPLPARESLAPVVPGGQSTPVANDGDFGCWWLRAAAEMATTATGNCLLPAGASPPRWTCFPPMAACARGVEAGSVRTAREFTVATCGRWGMTERREDVGIVVSELLTNALRHALPGPGQSWPGWPVQLGLLQPGSGVLCAVADPSPSAPVPRTPGHLAETGRGLQIVGMLSDEWGYITCATSDSTVKVVWAMFMTLPVRAGQALLA
jgi:anti-sigma regulatory factor (Ser/Thr protein kinase)